MINTRHSIEIAEANGSLSVSDLKWYLASDSLQRPRSLSEISQRIALEEAGILIDGGLLSVEIDRRIMGQIKHHETDSLRNELFYPKERTLTFEGEFKNVYIYKVPDKSDIPNMRPFVKRGMSGTCYQLGSIGSQLCAGPKWIQSSVSDVMEVPRGILGLFYKPPSITAQASTLAKAVIQSVRSGSFKVSEETFNERKSICNSCEYFDPSAFMGTGRCRVCGCGVAKLQMPQQECPKGKWGKV